MQKLTGEYYIQAFCKVYGMEAVCLRYFNIFGPRQAADSPYSGVIAQFIYKMMAGETPTINGDGSTSRDFTFVANAVQANLLACDAPKEFATGRVFNVGTGTVHTLNELYDVAEILGFKAKPDVWADAHRRCPALAGEHRSRESKELGYKPEADFRCRP